MMILEARELYPNPPANQQTKEQTHPTLLVGWWTTAFSLFIIIVRVCGRYFRIERLFPEDKVMLGSVAPLMIRMAFIHVVLVWGTNNTTTDGMVDDEVVKREVGSRLVLGARVFYAVLYVCPT